jgi:ATP-dependent DNA ligase
MDIQVYDRTKQEMKARKIEVGTFTKPADAKHRGVLNKSALEKVWDEVGPCFGYLKPDGWRIQVHIQHGKIKLFSRQSIDESNKEFPLLSQGLQKLLGEGQYILDTEVVGFDQFGKHTTLRRIRDAVKHVAILLDALWIIDRDITEISTEDRQDLILSTFSPYVGESLVLADYKRIESFLALDAIYQSFLDQTEPGYDGVILKRFNNTYFTDAIKVKREITVDALVIGISLSEKAKIQGNNIPAKDWASSLLIAVLDTQTNLWIPIGKVSGNDEDWNGVCETCKGKIMLGSYPTNIVPPPEAPDLWIDPEIVVQVTARTIRLGAKDSYIVIAEAPRDIFLRRDKDSSMVTTFDQLLEMGGINTRPPIPLELL